MNSLKGMRRRGGSVFRGNSRPPCPAHSRKMRRMGEWERDRMLSDPLVRPAPAASMHGNPSQGSCSSLSEGGNVHALPFLAVSPLPSPPSPSSPSQSPPLPLPYRRPRTSSMAFSLAISSWNSRSIASLGSSLMRGLFLMFLARLAYLGGEGGGGGIICHSASRLA